MRAVMFMFLAAALRAAAEEASSAGVAVTSPHGTLKVMQQTWTGDDVWHTTLVFLKSDLPSIVLAEDYRLPGRFFFSPDDQWLLQIQEFKDQSFHNLAFLYRIEPSGRIWRMEDPLSAAAFKYLEESESLSPAHLFHTGAQFEAWDFPAGVLRFSIHFRCGQYCDSTDEVKRSLSYDLQRHTFSATKKP
jgi:hypothetical protein